MISKRIALKNTTVIPAYSYVIPAKAGISNQQRKKQLRHSGAGRNLKQNK